ncbi:MAG TPA: hypothetical protein VIL64_05515, partial [Solirubrobacteraceae bacterium]
MALRRLRRLVGGTPAPTDPLEELRRRHALPGPGPADLDDLRGRSLTSYERKARSQNGEDGVLAELVRRVGAGERAFVEFGIGPGAEGNCVALADWLGWSGVFFEADPAP